MVHACASRNREQRPALFRRERVLFELLLDAAPRQNRRIVSNQIAKEFENFKGCSPSDGQSRWMSLLGTESEDPSPKEASSESRRTNVHKIEIDANKLDLRKTCSLYF